MSTCNPFRLTLLLKLDNLVKKYISVIQQVVYFDFPSYLVPVLQPSGTGSGMDNNKRIYSRIFL